MFPTKYTYLKVPLFVVQPYHRLQGDERIWGMLVSFSRKNIREKTNRKNHIKSQTVNWEYYSFLKSTKVMFDQTWKRSPEFSVTQILSWVMYFLLRETNISLHLLKSTNVWSVNWSLALGVPSPVFPHPVNYDKVCAVKNQTKMSGRSAVKS